jgi:mono/diheme cytochrome c family protein
MSITVMVLLSAAGLVVYPGMLQGGMKDDWPVNPRHARAVNPVPMDARSVGAVAEIWVHECASCHGDRGQGDGPAAVRRGWDAGDLSNPSTWRQSDGTLYWKMTQGRSPMPGYRDELSDEQRWQLVHYIRTLAPRPPDHAMPAPVRRGVAQLLQAYFDLTEAIIAAENDRVDADRLDALSEAMTHLASLTLETQDTEDLGPEVEQSWRDFLSQLRRNFDALHDAPDPEAFTEKFAALSQTLAQGVAAFGYGALEPSDRQHSGQVIQYGCTKALNGTSASWLQAAGQEPRNPYLSKDRHACIHQLLVVLDQQRD